MNSDIQRNIDELYPLPKGVKLRKRIFGPNASSPLFPIPTRGDSNPDTQEFMIRWEDPTYGLTVLVRERSEDSHLIADVVCTNADQLNKLAVSVALYGTKEMQMIRKTIPLAVPQQTGCSGSADFGLFSAAVEKLGTQLGVIVFKLI
jgi:hypothetical protein